MAKSIADLPDICLLNIFDHLPVVDLIKLPSVCRRWASLRGPVCCCRSELTVLIGEPYRPDPLDLINRSNFPDNRPSMSSFFRFNFRHESPEIELLYPLAGRLPADYPYPWFTLDTARRLMKFFPHITRLSLAINSETCTALACLLPFLHTWYTRLEYLSIRLAFDNEHQNPYSRRIYGDFFSALNKQRFLKGLTIEYSTSLDLQMYQLPLLRYLYDFNTNSMKFARLLKEETNKKPGWICLKRFGLDVELSQKKLLPFCDLSNLNTFRHINVNVGGSLVKLKRLLMLNRNLFYLRVTALENVTLYKLTKVLALTKKLGELKLVCKWTHTHPGLDDLQPYRSPRRLMHLKKLSLSFDFAYHSQLHSTDLGKVFPSLESLHITHHQPGCITCRSLALSDAELGSACIEKLLEPWIKQCTRLKQVISSFNGTETVWPTVRSELPEVARLLNRERIGTR